jgi:hypothetical protein
MQPLFLHIDIIDISIYFIIVLYILFEKFSQKKDIRDNKGQPYSFKEFWKVYWDNYIKVILITMIGIILKDELGLPVVEYILDGKVNVHDLNLNYALTAVMAYVLGKYGVKFKDDES